MAVLNCDYFSVTRKGFISFMVILPIDPPPVGVEPVKMFPAHFLLFIYCMGIPGIEISGCLMDK